MVLIIDLSIFSSWTRIRDMFGLYYKCRSLILTDYSGGYGYLSVMRGHSLLQYVGSNGTKLVSVIRNSGVSTVEGV